MKTKYQTPAIKLISLETDVVIMSGGDNLFDWNEFSNSGEVGQ